VPPQQGGQRGTAFVTVQARQVLKVLCRPTVVVHKLQNSERCHQLDTGTTGRTLTPDASIDACRYAFSQEF